MAQYMDVQASLRRFYEVNWAFENIRGENTRYSVAYAMNEIAEVFGQHTRSSQLIGSWTVLMRIVKAYPRLR